MVFGKVNLRAEPSPEEIHEQQARRPSGADALARQHDKKVNNNVLTGGSQITLKQSIVPVALVTILFFLWGFAYGLLDILNKHFQNTLGINQSKGGGLAAAYFGAYFLAPLTYSGYVCRRFGYRWTFIMGLSIYGVGALMFWPSAVKRSFGGFCGSMFIVGSGLATLETAANPYIAVCGPPKYSEIRLNLSQAFQAIGTVVAPLLGSRVFFSKVDDNSEQDLQNVQWVYLGIACFVFLLAVVFFFAPIPEISDADMLDMAETSPEAAKYEDKPIHKQYMLLWGVVAQFTYVGAQVAIAGYFINYCNDVDPEWSDARASDQLAIAQGLFALGRFMASFAMRFIPPRLILLVFSTMTVIWISVAMGVSHGVGGIAALSLVLFFESCMFPTIFTLSLRGLGRHTKRGASFLVSAVSGGALFPPMLGLVGDARGTRIGMVIPLVGFLVAWTFPIYLNLFKADMLDAYLERSSGSKEELKRNVSNAESEADEKGDTNAGIKELAAV